MFWDTLRSDIQHAVRLAAKSPLITALTVVALALGIGANSAIFAVVDSVLVKPLPYADGDRLVNVWSDATKQGRPRNTLSPANFKDFQKMSKTLDGLEAYFSFVTPFKVTGDDGNSEIVVGVSVTPRLFDLLGRKPIMGRPMSDDDAQPETLISYGFWQRRFGGDPAIIGRTMQVPGAALTIVGVMPPDFTFPYGSMLGPSGFTRATTIDMWAPIRFAGPLATINRMLTPQGQLVRGTHWLGAIGRMKPGVTVAEVQADMAVAARQMEQSYPDTQSRVGRHRGARARTDGRHDPRAAPRTAGRRRLRAHHRRGERGEPRAREKHRASEGARHARRARRRTPPHDPAGADRRAAARGRGRRRRVAAGALGRLRAGAARAGGSSAAAGHHTRRAHVVDHRGRVGAHRGVRRSAAGDRRDPDGAALGAAGEQPRHRRRRIPPARARRTRRRGSRAWP